MLDAELGVEVRCSATYSHRRAPELKYGENMDIAIRNAGSGAPVSLPFFSMLLKWRRFYGIIISSLFRGEQQSPQATGLSNC
jgi:hypothetical protein